MTKELKPCPFCGSEANGYEGDFAGCSNDSCEIWYGDSGLPVKEWNTRPREERLERALREIVAELGVSLPGMGKSYGYIAPVANAAKIARRALVEP